MSIADHPSNTKRGSLWICYNEKISENQIRNISLAECLGCEIIIAKKKGFVINLYRSLSQNQGEFVHFLFFYL